MAIVRFVNAIKTGVSVMGGRGWGGGSVRVIVGETHVRVPSIVFTRVEYIAKQILSNS